MATVALSLFGIIVVDESLLIDVCGYRAMQNCITIIITIFSMLICTELWIPIKVLSRDR